MKNNLFVLIIITLIFLGCSSVQIEKSDKIEQRIIFPQYSLIYYSDTETVIASAQFNKNNPAGVLIKLSAHSSISFNNNTLKAVEEKTSGRFFYQLKSTESFPVEAVFEYVNDDKKRFINKLRINSFELDEKKQNIIYNGGKLLLSFIGKTFNEDETLEAIFYNDKSEELFSFTPEIYDRTVVIYPEMLPPHKGNYLLYFIRRENSSKVNAMDRGGLIETEYHSKKFEINIP